MSKNKQFLLTLFNVFTYRLYEEATECVFRYYKWKGLDSCVNSQFESDLIWMINMRAAQWSQMMGMDIAEPEITQKCISMILILGEKIVAKVAYKIIYCNSELFYIT